MKAQQHLRVKMALPIVIVGLLSSMPAMSQQKVQFTQYMFNNLVINPAYAGADEALSLTFVQRRQWIGVDHAPSTQTLTAHSPFMEKRIGVGLTLINDRIGVHKNVSVLSNYAYHIKTGDQSYLSMGIQAGFHNRKSDYASLSGQSNDPKLYNAYISYTAFDFGTGVYFRSKKLHVGLSVPELLPEKVSINDTVSLQLSRINYFLFSKYRFVLNDKLEFEPCLLLKYLPGIPLSYDVNINFIYRKVLTTGVSYRKKESVDLLLKCQLNAQLQFGYSYDHPVGAAAGFSNGSHEIMVQYVFRYVQLNVTAPR
jgi:type IX secretion system PorP/SprF family membrane protein